MYVLLHGRNNGGGRGAGGTRPPQGLNEVLRIIDLDCYCKYYIYKHYSPVFVFLRVFHKQKCTEHSSSIFRCKKRFWGGQNLIQGRGAKVKKKNWLLQRKILVLLGWAGEVSTLSQPGDQGRKHRGVIQEAVQQDQVNMETNNSCIICKQLSKEGVDDYFFWTYWAIYKLLM